MQSDLIGCQKMPRKANNQVYVIKRGEGIGAIITED